MRYLPVHSFNALVKHEGMFVSTFSAIDKYINIAEDVIDALRDHNRECSGSVCTCVCTTGETEWKFAYTDVLQRSKCTRIVREASDRVVERFNKEHGASAEVATGHPDLPPVEGCMCPFMGK